MQILVTGADGFVGKNLCLRLEETKKHTIFKFTADSSEAELDELVSRSDFIFHLAGVNRPQNPEEFFTGNAGFTQRICASIAQSAKKPQVVYTSSTQALLDNDYGRSKRQAEESLLALKSEGHANVHIYRLTNIFGKWSRPNYNSAVATFCHNIARDLPIKINDPRAALRLVYIDDVIDAFLRLLDDPSTETPYREVSPVYETTVGEVADTLRSFKDCRSSLMIGNVGQGLTRALYATYVSFLPPESFTYGLTQHRDPRGVFVEMLKTPSSGQFSFFSAHPGITRGRHYHHSKTEKFLVLRGKARFKFRNLSSGERHEIFVDGDHPTVVETIPGWVHDITNIGEDEMFVMLWANEVFDPKSPDTYGYTQEL